MARSDCATALCSGRTCIALRAGDSRSAREILVTEVDRDANDGHSGFVAAAGKIGVCVESGRDDCEISDADGRDETSDVAHRDSDSSAAISSPGAETIAAAPACCSSSIVP